ncbi:MAG TPA: hypothetical protein VIZ32_03220 [Vicinamibacterales bacterium]|jgi:hypothetical protein
MDVRWRGFERMMDRIVDGYFGEPVQMFPMLPATVATEGEPDPNRQVIEITGILVMPGAAATGEGGTVGSGMATRVVTNDTWLSIQEDQLIKARLETWVEGDRVYFPDRNLWFTVLYPTPSVTARPQINLARMQNQPT